MAEKWINAMPCSRPILDVYFQIPIIPPFVIFLFCMIWCFILYYHLFKIYDLYSLFIQCFGILLRLWGTACFVIKTTILFLFVLIYSNYKGDILIKQTKDKLRSIFLCSFSELMLHWTIFLGLFGILGHIFFCSLKSEAHIWACLTVLCYLERGHCVISLFKPSQWT